MGLFRKGFREGKTYDYASAKKIVQQKGFENCAIEVTEKGYIITKEVDNREKASQKVSQKERQQEFKNRINGNGTYQEINFKPCDYERANRTNRWKAKDFTRG